MKIDTNLYAVFPNIMAPTDKGDACIATVHTHDEYAGVLPHGAIASMFLAAPDMVEALRDLIKLYEATGDYQDCSDCRGDCRCVVCAAKSALSKACGGYSTTGL